MDLGAFQANGAAHWYTGAGIAIAKQADPAVQGGKVMVALPAVSFGMLEVIGAPPPMPDMAMPLDLAAAPPDLGATPPDLAQSAPADDLGQGPDLAPHWSAGDDIPVLPEMGAASMADAAGAPPAPATAAAAGSPVEPTAPRPLRSRSARSCCSPRAGDAAAESIR